ncbi:MAG: YbaN family protein [Candidatus Poseidoniaceae archaeon]|nr:YbaN family protein [Candidatus Poseidoniaceae archaeon]
MSSMVSLATSESVASVKSTITDEKKELLPLEDTELIEEILAEHQPSSNPISRSIWVMIGSLFVAFAVIGVFLPGWPTTSWLVAAAYCYARSSRRMFKWLLTNRLFGNALLDYYRAGKALPLHSKIFICGFIALVSGLSIWALTRAGDPGFGQTTIAIVAIIGVWWVGWKVPTIE